MKKTLFFLSLLLTSICTLAQEDEKSFPKGLLLDNPVVPIMGAYTTEKTILEASSVELGKWERTNWQEILNGITTSPRTGEPANKLESPVIQLPTLRKTTERLNLYLKETYEIESYHDQGQVQISDDNGNTWKTVSIRQGKSDWRTSIINLTEYAGKNIKIALTLVTDQSYNFQGWNIAQLALKQEIVTNSELSVSSIIGTNATKTATNARTQGVLTGQMVGVDAQRFPRYIFSHLKVRDGGLPIANLDKTNFAVREYVINDVGGTDTIPASDFTLYSPTGTPIPKPVDIVFVMDNSISLGEERSAVAANVANFVNQLASDGFDFQLGLCRFGQAANNGIPIFHDNARFYTDASEFINVWNTVNTIDGGIEPSWDALYQSATQYSFRPGAQKVFILITDEAITGNPGNNIMWNVIQDRQIVIDKLLDAGVRAYTLVSPGVVFESDFGAIATATGGQSYNISAPFNIILQAIGNEINDTYTIRYPPTNPVFDGLLRKVEVKVNYNGQKLKLLGSYTPGAAPIIIRTNQTLALHQQAQMNNISTKIEVEAIDWDSFITNQVTLYYRTAVAPPANPSYIALPMTRPNPPVMGLPTRSIWEATIPAAHVVGPGIQYYIRATDGQATTTAPEFIDRPGYPFSFAVLPNLPPVLNHTPVETADPKSAIVFKAEAIDNTHSISTVYLYYAKETDNTYTRVQMSPTAIANEYSYTLPAINTSTILNYYIVAIDNFGVSVFSGTDISPHSVAVGVPWGIPPSPAFHTIKFFSSGSFQSTVTIDNQPIAVGDVIGVFYTDANGNLKPAGSLEWKGASTSSLVAYGKNPNTPASVKDGFVNGEAFTFKIFRKQQGDIYSTEYTVYINAISLATFQVGKQTYIKEMRAFSEQTIELPQGLSLWSTYLNPKSTAFTDLLAPIAPSVQKVLDSYGNTYTPGGTSNTLTNYVPGYGYQIFMNAPATLRVKGSKLNPTTVNVNLNDQGVIIGSPYASPQDVEAVFPRLTSNIYVVDRYVTNSAGNLEVETYSPAWDLNTWTYKNMEPGKGYYVYVFTNQTFTFPAPTGPYTARMATGNTPSTAQPITSLNDYMHVLIPSQAWNTTTSEKDEIRIYSTKGKLLGKSIVRDKGTIITLDGVLLREQEPFYLRMWDHTTLNEEPLFVAEWKSGNNRYLNHSASVIGKFQKAGSMSETGLNVFPNPVEAEGEINFSLQEENEVTIELYDAQGGKVMRTVTNQRYPKGNHEITFNKQGLPAGLYVVKVITGGSFETKRIMVK